MTMTVVLLVGVLLDEDQQSGIGTGRAEASDLSSRNAQDDPISRA